MQIGLFHALLPMPDRKPGGVDVHVHRLADRLVLQGHEVTVFSCSPKPAGAAYRHVAIAPLAWGTGKLRRLLGLPLLLNAIDTTGLDLLHLHGDDWFFLRRRLPTVRTFHGSAYWEARSASSVKRRVVQYATVPLEWLSAALATRVTAVAPHPGPLLKAGPPYLACGVEIVAEDRPPPAVPAILFVGTWSGRKRGSLLFDVFRRMVRPAVPNAELWLVSDWAPEYDGVRWFQRPDDRELADLLRAASVFCMPSAYEALGIPYLEAMASGTPVVATPNPGAGFVLEGGRAGALVGPEQLGRVLVELLESPARRRRLSDRGRERAEFFAWDAVLDRHEEVYEETLRAARRPSG